MAKKKPNIPEARFRSMIEESTNRLWKNHFRIPSSIAKRFIEGNNRRVVCRLNASAEFQCAILHRGDNLYLITVNQSLRRALQLEIGDRIDVMLRKDVSEFGHAVPDELLAVFRQDPDSRRWFDALTIGRRRTLLYLINAVKDPDKRISRALAIADHLRRNRGILNYRQLHEALRDPRTRSTGSTRRQSPNSGLDR